MVSDTLRESDTFTTAPVQPNHANQVSDSRRVSDTFITARREHAPDSPHQLTIAPERRTRSDHLPISACWKLARLRVDSPPCSTPWLASRLSTAGSPSASCAALRRVASTGSGVAEGA